MTLHIDGTSPQGCARCAGGKEGFAREFKRQTCKACGAGEDGCDADGDSKYLGALERGSDLSMFSLACWGRWCVSYDPYNPWGVDALMETQSCAQPPDALCCRPPVPLALQSAPTSPRQRRKRSRPPRRPRLPKRSSPPPQSPLPSPPPSPPALRRLYRSLPRRRLPLKSA